MKKCRIALLLSNNNEFHCAVASGIRRVLGTSHELFSVTPIAVALTQEAISNKVIQKINEYDVFIAIGQRCSIYLKEATKDLINGPVVIFIGIPDPVKLGLIDSLHTPGGRTSAIIRIAADPLEVAKKLVVLGSYINKVIIPYWPDGEAGHMSTQVRLVTDYFATHNITSEPLIVTEKAELLTTLKEQLQKHDVLMLLEGNLDDSHRELSYLCWNRDAIFCADSPNGIMLGAACTYSGSVYCFAEELERVLTLFWEDRKEIGLLPISPLPNNRFLSVNTTIFRMIGFPDAGVKKLMKTSKTNLKVTIWPPCPL